MADAPHRLVSADKRPEDEAAIRPQFLADFAGQEAARKNLGVFIQSAKSRGEALDHVLFVGPPGLGKTTLAQIVARELGVNFRSTSGPVIAKGGRSGGAAHQSRAARRPVHRRDSPSQSGDRRNSLSGDGGFPARPHHRRGAGGALGEDRSRPVHPDRRDDPRRAPHHAVARSVRHSDPAQFLHHRGAAGHRRAQRQGDRPRPCRRRRERDRQALARHAAHRRAPAAGACAISPWSKARRASPARSPTARSSCSTSTRSASTRWIGAISTRSRSSSAAARSASRPSPPRSPSPATRSRTSSSPISSSSDSCSARRAGGC